MQASYTWSKDLSDIQAILTGSGANSNLPTALGQQYGPVGFSHPQRFVINYSYDLPFGNHSGALGLLANGWNVSGVTTVQDGTPLTITNQNSGTVYDHGNLRHGPRADVSRIHIRSNRHFGWRWSPGWAVSPAARAISIPPRSIARRQPHRIPWRRFRADRFRPSSAIAAWA